MQQNSKFEIVGRKIRRFFEDEQTAQWFYLIQTGVGNKVKVFYCDSAKIWVEIKWEPDLIINQHNAPFRVIYSINEQDKVSCFIKESKAKSYFLSLKRNNISCELWLNINGIDYVLESEFKKTG